MKNFDKWARDLAKELSLKNEKVAFTDHTNKEDKSFNHIDAWGELNGISRVDGETDISLKKRINFSIKSSYHLNRKAMVVKDMEVFKDRILNIPNSFLIDDPISLDKENSDLQNMIEILDGESAVFQMALIVKLIDKLGKRLNISHDRTMDKDIARKHILKKLIKDYRLLEG